VIRQAGPADRAIIEAIVHDAYSVYVARIGKPPGPMLGDDTALIAAGAGLDKPEPPVEGDVFGHLFVRIKAQFAEAAAAGFVLGKRDQPAAEALALARRPHRDVVKQQMVGFSQQHDERGDVARRLLQDAHRPGARPATTACS
jgi:hypothetical protein